MRIAKLSTKVVERLGYYVYLYIDPRSNEVFYVGKGYGQRVLSHLNDNSISRKVKKIEEIRKRGKGKAPRIEILAYGLQSAEQALQIESAVIDVLGKKRLTNQVRGWNSCDNGRQSLEDLITRYDAKPAKITDPVILIRVNQLYEHGMSDKALYEITRGVWRVGKQREKAKYAMAVYGGLVREVYQIKKWTRAGTTRYRTRTTEDVNVPGRWEFSGAVAEQTIRDKYVGKSVENYFATNSRYPIRYIIP